MQVNRVVGGADALNLAPSGAGNLVNVRYDPNDLPTETLSFMQERHLATLSLVTTSGELHVTPVGFSWDSASETARVITFAESKKVRLIEAEGPLVACLSQVDGGRWLSLHGTASVTQDPSVNADAERRYAARYRPPGDRGADRRTIEIRVAKMVGRA